jgi:hypothetical protein
MSEVSLTCFISSCLSSSFHSGPNAASGETDERLARSDVLGVGELLEAALDIIGEVGIARLPS